MAPMVSILTLIRNRDCLMCYLRHRMERIENMRWDVGDMPKVCSGRAASVGPLPPHTHGSPRTRPAILAHHHHPAAGTAGPDRQHE